MTQMSLPSPQMNKARSKEKLFETSRNKKTCEEERVRLFLGIQSTFRMYELVRESRKQHTGSKKKMQNAEFSNNSKHVFYSLFKKWDVNQLSSRLKQAEIINDLVIFLDKLHFVNYHKCKAAIIFLNISPVKYGNIRLFMQIIFCLLLFEIFTRGTSIDLALVFLKKSPLIRC